MRMKKRKNLPKLSLTGRQTISLSALSMILKLALLDTKVPTHQPREKVEKLVPSTSISYAWLASTTQWAPK